MDFLSVLPVEISENIFKLLNIKDLFLCMAVSKRWRDLINTNYLWGHFYNRYDIIELQDHEDIFVNNVPNVLHPLCSRAHDLKNFLLSPAYNWKRRSSNWLCIYLLYRQWKVVCNEPYIAILYLSNNVIYLFKNIEQNWEHIESIEVILMDFELTISLSNKYIVLNTPNITLVHQLIDGHSKPFKIFAVEGTHNIVSADNNFDNFIREFKSPNKRVLNNALVDDMLLMTLSNGTKHCINLTDDSHKVISTALIHTKVSLFSQLIINHLDFNISITNTKGLEISSFMVPHIDKLFYINSSVIVICFPSNITNQEFPIECRNILSGELIRTFFVQERTRLTLCRKRDILYLLSTHLNSYIVKSLCITTGNVIWQYEVGIQQELTFYGSFLLVIEQRFLVVYPAPSGDKNFAFFNLKGKLLYESTFPPGVLLHYSDRLLLTVFENRLNSLSFT